MLNALAHARVVRTWTAGTNAEDETAGVGLADAIATTHRAPARLAST